MLIDERKIKKRIVEEELTNYIRSDPQLKRLQKTIARIDADDDEGFAM